MYKLILFLGICSAFAAGSKPPKKLPARLPVPDNKCQKIVGCYYNDDDNIMPDETVNIEMADVSLCTHLIYKSYDSIGKNASVDRADYNEVTDTSGFQNVNNLRKKNRSLKTLIALVAGIGEALGNNRKYYKNDTQHRQENRKLHIFCHCYD